MKKNYVKLLFISFFLFLIFPLSASASNGYTIEDYEVDIKVNENNVLNVKEVIDADFIYEKHGIIRNIPYKNTYYRTGKTVETKAKIRNLKVNAPYSKTKENGELKIKIGSASETITGNKQYIITYDYDVGDDDIEEYRIVGSKEADPSNNKISNESPIAMAIMNAKAGEIRKVASPNGEYEVEIVEIC